MVAFAGVLAGERERHDHVRRLRDGRLRRTAGRTCRRSRPRPRRGNSGRARRMVAVPPTRTPIPETALVELGAGPVRSRRFKGGVGHGRVDAVRADATAKIHAQRRVPGLDRPHRAGILSSRAAPPSTRARGSGRTLDGFTDQVFQRRPTSRVRESHEAYAVDALMRMADAATANTAPIPTTMLRRVEVPAYAETRVHLVLLADSEHLGSGDTSPGEICGSRGSGRSMSRPRNGCAAMRSSTSCSAKGTTSAPSRTRAARSPRRNTPRCSPRATNATSTAPAIPATSRSTISVMVGRSIIAPATVNSPGNARTATTSKATKAGKTGPNSPTATQLVPPSKPPPDGSTVRGPLRRVRRQFATSRGGGMADRGLGHSPSRRLTTGTRARRRRTHACRYVTRPRRLGREHEAAFAGVSLDRLATPTNATLICEAAARRRVRHRGNR